MSARVVVTMTAAIPLLALCTPLRAQTEAELPPGVEVVWDLRDAWRRVTPTRERICVNGLWRWQPADGVSDTVPAGEALPDGGWSARLSLPGLPEDGDGSVMPAQHGLPMRGGQWCRVTFRTRAEEMRGVRVNMTITNADTRCAYFDYQRFAPTREWRPMEFLVQSDGSGADNTRLQIWYSSVGDM